MATKKKKATKKVTKELRPGRVKSPVQVNQEQPKGIPRKFKNSSGQGDVLLLRVNGIPKDAARINPAKDNGFVVAHSESGHHHVMEPATSTDFLAVFRDLSGRLFAEVQEGSKALLRHEKQGKDAHQPIEIPAGTFEIKRAQEHTPQGLRRVTD